MPLNFQKSLDQHLFKYFSPCFISHLNLRFHLYVLIFSQSSQMLSVFDFHISLCVFISIFYLLIFKFLKVECQVCDNPVEDILHVHYHYFLKISSTPFSFFFSPPILTLFLTDLQASIFRLRHWQVPCLVRAHTLVHRLLTLVFTRSQKGLACHFGCYLQFPFLYRYSPFIFACCPSFPL